jgi:hypothetical protein
LIVKGSACLSADSVHRDFVSTTVVEAKHTSMGFDLGS